MKSLILSVLVSIGLAQQFNFTGTVVQDTCKRGSDEECRRFGDGMCCAFIDYTYRGDHL